MSQKVKIVWWVILGVIIVGAGVFAYLAKTDKLKSSADVLSGPNLTLSVVNSGGGNVISDKLFASSSLITAIPPANGLSADKYTCLGAYPNNNCTGIYPLDTVINLTAQISPNTTVTWDGACSGHDASCAVNMSRNKIVYVYFSSPVISPSPSPSPSSSGVITVTTNAATNTTASGATLKGSLSVAPNSNYSVGFFYYPNAGCTGPYTSTAVNPSSVNFLYNATKLTQNTAYSYKAYYALSSLSMSKAVFGSCVSFKTQSSISPSPTLPPLITGCAGATFYRDANYANTHVCLTPGNYTNVTAIGLDDNSISSVKLEPGYTATIYQDSNFGGLSYNVTQDLVNLAQLPMKRVLTIWISWNDQISSVKVAKTP